jgi:hypothetical protein
LPGSRFCGVPAHQALAGQESAQVVATDGEGDTAVEEQVAAEPEPVAATGVASAETESFDAPAPQEEERSSE